MSWWVGKDRQTFNAALHEQQPRMLREGASLKVKTTDPDTEPSLKPQKPVRPRVIRARRPVLVMTRAERRQKHIEAGLCADCGRRRVSYAYRCDPCQLAIQAWNRKQKGHSEWKPGSPGRPPRTTTSQIQSEAS